MPLNVWILVAAQALAMCTAPFVIVIGSIQGGALAPAAGWATLPVALVVVGTVVSIRPVTRMMARVGRKPVMLAGTLAGTLAGLTGVLASWLGSFPLLCLAALIGGSGLAVVHQYRFAAMEAVPPGLAGSAASRVLLGGLVAAWLGPEVATLGAGETARYPFLSSWAGLVMVQLAALLVLATGYHPGSEIRSEATAAGDGRPLRQILADPLVLAAMGAAAIGYAVMSFIMTATPLSMTQMAGHSLDDAKHVIQLHIVAMYLPSLVSGWLTRVVGLPAMLLGGLVAYLFCVLLALSGIGFHHYLGALLLLGVGWNLLFVGGTVLLAQGYRPEERFRVQGLNDMLVFGSQALASLSAGAVFAWLQWDGLVLLTLPFLLLEAVLVGRWLLRRRRARPLQVPERD